MADYCLNTLRPRRDGRHFADDILKCIFIMKMFEFRLKFHWSLFLRVQLTIFQHWFRKWLGAVQATSHFLNQWWLDYRRIYASLGLNELIRMSYFTNSLLKWRQVRVTYSTGQADVIKQNCWIELVMSTTDGKWLYMSISHVHIELIHPDT